LARGLPLAALLAATLTFAASAPASRLAPGERPPCETEVFEGARFEVCGYDPARDELRLAAHDGAGRPIDSLTGLSAFLGPAAARVRFAMNAGMYQTDQRPLGLFVAGGAAQAPLNRRTGFGNFYLAPNGVFWVGADGAPHVTETAAFAAQPAGGAAWATQSGPLLVAAGAFNPHISADGASLKLRNAVGVRGGEALFVISDDRVSFGRLARFLRDALGCPDALYLDGAVSSLWSPADGRLDARHGLGTFVVVLRRG
jgi:uncharacterized protein YigE (DUF2233 family)